MVRNLLNLGQTRDFFICDPECDYDTVSKIIRMQIQCVGELVFMNRSAKCFCGSGRKIKHCHPDVNENSLIAKMLNLYAIVDERNTHGVSSPCQKGCAHCCTDDFEVHFSEFLAVLDYLGIGYEFSRNKRWKDFIASWNPKVEGICFFLNQDDKSCRIYAVRPLVCRNYGITRQASEMPCHFIIDPNILLDESKYPPIDYRKNRIDITGTKDVARASKIQPLTLWIQNLDDDGLLRTKKMRDLLYTATHRNIDEFIRVFVLPSVSHK